MKHKKMNYLQYKTLSARERKKFSCTFMIYNIIYVNQTMQFCLFKIICLFIII